MRSPGAGRRAPLGARRRFAALLLLAALGLVVLAVTRGGARRVPVPRVAVVTPHGSPTPVVHGTPVNTGVPSAPLAATCTGAPLTSPRQIRPNTVYCGGTVSVQMVLAAGDTWVNGAVSGVATASQRGAVECASNCTLVNVAVHDNPRAFAGVYMPADGTSNVTISGGRISGNGSLGIGGGHVNGLLVSGVEIDHNGASADCSFEGGGFKGANDHNVRITENSVHDNNCVGIWLDINSAGVEIDHNRVVANTHEGVFYEISQDGAIHDNTMSSNGFRTNGPSCTWLWGGGITVASSFNVEIWSNSLTDNCNGITGTQQVRQDSTPPAHVLAHLNVHDNSIRGAGRTGVVSDNGDNLNTRAIAFKDNVVTGGQTMCGLSC